MIDARHSQSTHCFITMKSFCDIIFIPCNFVSALSMNTQPRLTEHFLRNHKNTPPVSINKLQEQCTNMGWIVSRCLTFCTEFYKSLIEPNHECIICLILLELKDSLLTCLNKIFKSVYALGFVLFQTYHWS